MLLNVLCFGNAAMLVQAFNGLAAITASPSFKGLIVVGMLISLITAVAKGAFLNKFEPLMIFSAYLAYSLMFVPKVSVSIQPVYGLNFNSGSINNLYDGYFDVVGNVPIGLAAPLAITSQIGFYLANTFETAFSSPVESKLLSNGYLDAFQVLLKMRDFSMDRVAADASGKGNVRRSLANYISDCVLFDVNQPDPANKERNLTLDAIVHSPDPWADMQITYVNIYTTLYLDSGDPSGEQVSCNDAYPALSQYLKNPVNPWFEKVLMPTILEQVNKIPNKGANDPTTTATTNADLMGAYTTTALAAVNLSTVNAMDYMVTAVVKNALADGQSNALMNANSVTEAIILTQADARRQVAWVAEKSMFEKVMQPVMAFVEVLMVAAGPIMGFAVAAFGVAGLQVLGKFLMMHIWVCLWAPTYAICNMYIHSVVQQWATMTSDRGNVVWTSIADSDVLTKQLQEWVATGSMLAASTPVLTLMMLYGSSMVASQIAGRIGGREHIDTSQAAPPIATGQSFVQYGGQFTGNTGGPVVNPAASSSHASFGRTDLRVDSSGQESSIASATNAGITSGIRTSQTTSQGVEAKVSKDRAETWGSVRTSLHAAALDTTAAVSTGMGLNQAQSLQFGTQLQKAYESSLAAQAGIQASASAGASMGGGTTQTLSPNAPGAPSTGGPAQAPAGEKQIVIDPKTGEPHVVSKGGNLPAVSTGAPLTNGSADIKQHSGYSAEAGLKGGINAGAGMQMRNALTDALIATRNVTGMSQKSFNNAMNYISGMKDSELASLAHGKNYQEAMGYATKWASTFAQDKSTESHVGQTDTYQNTQRGGTNNMETASFGNMTSQELAQHTSEVDRKVTGVSATGRMTDKDYDKLASSPYSVNGFFNRFSQSLPADKREELLRDRTGGLALSRQSGNVDKIASSNESKATYAKMNYMLTHLDEMPKDLRSEFLRAVDPSASPLSAPPVTSDISKPDVSRAVAPAGQVLQRADNANLNGNVAATAQDAAGRLSTVPSELDALKHRTEQGKGVAISSFQSDKQSVDAAGKGYDQKVLNQAAVSASKFGKENGKFGNPDFLMAIAKRVNEKDMEGVIKLMDSDEGRQLKQSLEQRWKAGATDSVGAMGVADMTNKQVNEAVEAFKKLGKYLP